MKGWLPKIVGFTSSNLAGHYFRKPARRWDDSETVYYPNLHSTAHRGELIMVGRMASMPSSSSSAHSSESRSNRSRSESPSAKMDSIPTTDGVLWVDAVGGFLVTLKDEITIGQAVPQASAEMAIQADVSRRHATVRRVGEDYLIQPFALLTVNRQSIVTSTTLVDGDEIGLGESVRIGFRKPHPLSNTARLDVLSGQRLTPAADGVLMMGQSCLLGSASNNHVCCAHWDESLVLSRGEDNNLRFRAGERVEIDGQAVGDRGQIDWGSRMSGKNFAISLERL